MVQYNTKDWFGLIFKFHKSDTFRVLFWVMLSISIYTGLVVYAEISLLGMEPKASPVMHSLLGFVISLLLVFRTNTAYDRWWEGRKQWGALVNVSRNLAFKIRTYVRPSDERMRTEEYVRLYAEVLKSHLRKASVEELNALLPSDWHAPEGAHVPNHLSALMLDHLEQARQKSVINDAAFLAIVNDLNAFTDICGACERIKNTPIPYTYNIFIKKFIFIFIITMPFAFVGQFGYWSILITVFTFYTLASLELIAETIEDPFGRDADDLPTDQLAEMITANAKQIFRIPKQKHRD